MYYAELNTLMPSCSDLSWISINFSPFNKVRSCLVRTFSQTRRARSLLVRGEELSSRLRAGCFCFSSARTGGLGLFNFLVGGRGGDLVVAVATGSCGTISRVPPGRLFGSAEDAVLSFGTAAFFSRFLFLASAISSAVEGRTFMASKFTTGSPAHNGTDEGPYKR